MQVGHDPVPALHTRPQGNQRRRVPPDLQGLPAVSDGAVRTYVRRIYQPFYTMAACYARSDPPLILHPHRNLMAPDEMKNLGFHDDSKPTPEPQSKGPPQ